ncbi:MAG: hypothetical protein H6R27_2158 [Proteobacteria bacterium]|nr:hypothetical protein [Pseudomonadota bacterium]
MNARRLRRAFLGLLLLAPASGHAWPLDGYADTGIRRVEGSRLANEGQVRDVRQPPGALLPTSAVDLRLTGHRSLEPPAPDPEFTASVVRLLGSEADRYGIAVLDLTDPQRPRYAEHRGDHQQNVGSVGKLVVAMALFQALADTYPNDTEKRTAVLKNTQVTADAFAHWDHHTIRLFDPATKTLVRRIEQFFRDTPGRELTALFDRTFVEPLTRNGLDVAMLRQGSFLTAEGKQLVSGVGNSYGTARELMRLLLRMEQGRLVDEWSSRQIKRLLYMTERRIRYASSPALADSAVYFKSGSLYDCEPEPGFNCGPYRGNVRNYMNSVVIVESPASGRRLHYAVTLISNVLRKNSAATHQALAADIHRLVEGMHAGAAPAAR